MLSRTSWFTPNTGTKLQCWTTSVCQGNWFHDDKTFEEIISKESWTFRNYCSSWTSILHYDSPNTILNQIQPPPPPVEVDDNIEYEIAEILDSKLDNCQKCRLLYLVWWAGYEGTDQEIDWLVTTELTHTSELVADFYSTNPSKPGPLNLKQFIQV